MAKKTDPKCSSAGTILQQALQDGLANLPVILLEHQISKKFKQQGIKQPRGLARRIAEHVLKGNTEPFVSRQAARGRDLNLTIDDSDLEQVVKALECFQKEQLPALLLSMGRGIAKRTLKDLKARWPVEQKLQ